MVLTETLEKRLNEIVSETDDEKFILDVYKFQSDQNKENKRIEYQFKAKIIECLTSSDYEIEFIDLKKFF